MQDRPPQFLCVCRKGDIPISSFSGPPKKRISFVNEVSFQVLPPKNVVLCVFKAGRQTHFLCTINVNHNVKSLNLSENGQKLSFLRVHIYILHISLLLLQIHGVDGAKSDLAFHTASLKKGSAHSMYCHTRIFVHDLL